MLKHVDTSVGESAGSQERPAESMQNTIVLEEHFAILDTVQDAAPFCPPEHWPELKGRLLKATDRRLQEMDKHGVEMMVMSLNAPAIQSIPQPAKALEIARRANDTLGEEIAGHPERFRAFAALPMQDPQMAAIELERCVRDLGFVGALVNGFSERQGVDGPVFYDLPEYRPFWKTVERLGLPFYLHPRNPLEQDARIYEGHPWLMGPAWAFAQETAVHALRLMASGLFDECPRLNIILGHLGEGFAVLHVACGSPQWLDEAAYLSRQGELWRLLRAQLLPDNLRQLQHAVSSGRTPGHRLQPVAVLR